MTERIRGWKLQQLRRRLFMANPLCAICHENGHCVVGVELDHITPISKGGTNDETNLQFLCAECHRAKTARDLGHTYKPVIGKDGWPIQREGEQKSLNDA